MQLTLQRREDLPGLVRRDVAHVRPNLPDQGAERLGHESGCLLAFRIGHPQCILPQLAREILHGIDGVTRILLDDGLRDLVRIVATGNTDIHTYLGFRPR